MAKSVIQVHHIQYENKDHRQPEITVKITKGEHKILTLMQWYLKKKVSKGFIKAIKVWLAMNEDRAVDLKKRLKMSDEA